MSFLAPDHPDYDAIYGDAIDRYCEVETCDDEAEPCACGACHCEQHPHEA